METLENIGAQPGAGGWFALKTFYITATIRNQGIFGTIYIKKLINFFMSMVPKICFIYAFKYAFTYTLARV